MGRELVVVLISLEQAFDSVGRLALDRELKFYKCDPRLIDVVVDLEMGYRTEIWRNSGETGLRVGLDKNV